MKNFKLLFTILLLSVFTAQSQVKPYVINQQLQLKTVPLGISSDSILVVDSAGLVKYVLKSSIGGGGSQDLQGVLDNGSQAVLVDGLFKIENSSTGFGSSIFEVGGSQVSIFSGTDSGTATSINIDGDGRLDLRYDTNVGEPASTKVTFEEPTTLGAVLTFPNKTGIIATLGDMVSLGLPSVLSNDSDASGLGFNIAAINFKNTTVATDYIQITNDRINYYGNGKVNRLLPNSFEFEGSETALKYPEKSGEFTIATKDDISLQTMLGTDGSDATMDSGTTGIRLGVGVADSRESEIKHGNNDSTIYGYARVNVGGTTLTHIDGVNSGSLGIIGGKTFISESVDSFATDVKFTDPTASTTLNFPAKDAGTYTLATTADTTLQSMVNAGGSSGAMASKGSSLVGILYGSAGYESFAASMDNGLSGSSKDVGVAQVDNSSVQIQVTHTDDPFAVGGTMTRVTTLSNDFQVKLQAGANFTELRFSPPVYGDGATILVPSLPTTRTYKLSVAEVFTSATTSDLSGSQLDIVVPSAQAGDRVHAISITGGAKVYEKTTTGWVEYSVTVVAP